MKCDSRSLGVPPSCAPQSLEGSAVLRLGVEREELAMSYGAAAPIGDCDRTVERAGRIPGGVDAGIERDPFGFIVYLGVSAKERKCLEPAVEGNHLAARRRVSPLCEQIVGDTDTHSGAGFGLGLRLHRIRVQITTTRIFVYDPAVGRLTVAGTRGGPVVSIS